MSNFSAKKNQEKKTHVGINIFISEKSRIENLCTQLKITQSELIKDCLNSTHNLNIK
jgi:hypothetical protein